MTVKMELKKKKKVDYKEQLIRQKNNRKTNLHMQKIETTKRFHMFSKNLE